MQDDRALAVQILKETHRFGDRRMARARDAALFQGEMAVLGCLYGCTEGAEGPLSPSQISAELGVSRAQVTSALNSLEKKGLLQRQPSQSDRRRAQVTLTEEGRAFIQGQTDLFVEKVTHIIRQMGREDFLQMISLVKAAFQAAFQYDREHPEQSPRGPRHTGEGRERD